MKKFSYYTLFLLLLISCKEEEKKINVPSPQKAISRIDSVTYARNKPANNILEKKDSLASSNVKSISELWATYKTTKILAAKFVSENNLDSIIVYLDIAADAASKLSREDIASWQLNNIGHYSINEYKDRTDLDIRLRQLESLTNLKAKGLHLEETKSIFSYHFKILSNAKIYLHKAQILDRKFKKTERTDIIKRNIQFIDWVDNFISGRGRTKYE
jgi:hypothetical protein